MEDKNISKEKIQECFKKKFMVYMGEGKNLAADRVFVRQKLVSLNENSGI